MDDRALAELRELLGERLSTSPSALDLHGRDESALPPSPPDAVAFPRSTAEVVAVVGICAGHGLPVIPYGADSSLEGHVLATRGGVSVDTQLMDEIRRVCDAAAAVRPRAPGVAADGLLAARRAAPDVVEPALLAELLVDAGRLTAALDVVDEASPAPRGARLAMTGASVERLLGRHDAARRRLLRALQATDPDSGEAAQVLAHLAVAAYQRGDYGEMRAWAQQVAPAVLHGGALQAVAAILLAVGDAFSRSRASASSRSREGSGGGLRCSASSASAFGELAELGFPAGLEASGDETVLGLAGVKRALGADRSCCRRSQLAAE